MKTGIELIAIERQEQVERHGYTVDQDAGYVNNELISGAKAYLCAHKHEEGWSTFPAAWPFGMTSFKPSEDKIKNLVKAGAMIAAEIDRLNRSEP